MYKLIKTPDQFIIVTDDTIIKEDELFLMGNEVIQNSSLLTDEWCKSKQPKVIAEQNQIDFNGFEDIFGYVDVENFKYFKDRLPFYSRKENESHDAYLIRISERSGFEIGFKKSQKLYSNKQFTLEDMKNCFFNGGNMKDEQDWNLYIHSLQHKEWIVEIEQSNNKIKITKVINKHNKIPN